MSERFGVWIVGYFGDTHGYGQIASRIARYLLSRGVKIRLQHIGREASHHDIPQDIRPFVTTSSENPWPWELIIAPPPDFHGLSPDKRHIWFTMWESTRLHPAWIDQFNLCDAIIVPSDFCHTLFDANGVNCPIFKVPLGVDSSVFRPITSDEKENREDAAPTTVVGAAGRIYTKGGARKNIAAAIEAFSVAFMEDDYSVRFELKLSPQCPEIDWGDDRVHIIRESWSEQRFARWLRSLSAYVNVSHAEGFDLITLEAMASGVPVVTTAYSGRADYANERTALCVPFDLEPASGLYDGLGLWSKPSMWSVADMLVKAVSRGPDVQRACSAGRRVAESMPWEDTCGRVLAILAEAGVFRPVVDRVVLPSGVSVASAASQPDNEVQPQDEFALRFGVGRARRRSMPVRPDRPEQPPPDGILVVGPSPAACGVGQYARQVACALGAEFAGYCTREKSPRSVVYHHHRHYWESDPINVEIAKLYGCGSDIVLDVHDPGGIEELGGFVAGVIYHSENFRAYIEEVLPGVPSQYIPLMSPDFSADTTEPLVSPPVPPATEFVVGWSGLWNPHKGVDILVDAVRIWRERGASIGLLAIGAIHDINHEAARRSRRAYEDAVAMATRLRLLDQVALYAGMFAYSDIEAAMRTCDCFCIPYTTMVPGQSSAVASLLPFGKPIIVSDVPMFRDVIGECAKPLEKLTSECLADTVQYMMQQDAAGREEWTQKAEECRELRKPSVIAAAYREFLSACQGGVQA